MKQSILLLLAGLIALPALAAESPARQGDDGPNVLLSLTLTDGDRECPIRALVLDGQRLRTTTGWQVPTQTTVGETTTAIAYQDIGMQVTLHVRIVGPGRIRASGEVELGTIDEQRAAAIAGGAPWVTTFRHVFDVVLADGVSTTLAEVPDPVSGSVVLTANAEIQ